MCKSIACLHSGHITHMAMGFAHNNNATLAPFRSVHTSMDFAHNNAIDSSLTWSRSQDVAFVTTMELFEERYAAGKVSPRCPPPTRPASTGLAHNNDTTLPTSTGFAHNKQTTLAPPRSIPTSSTHPSNASTKLLASED